MMYYYTHTFYTFFGNLSSEFFVTEPFPNLPLKHSDTLRSNSIVTMHNYQMFVFVISTVLLVTFNRTDSLFLLH